MLFSTFAISIWVFTIFLNFLDSEVVLLPLIVILSVVGLLYYKFYKKDKTKILFRFFKLFFLGVLGNCFALIVILLHLYSRGEVFVNEFLGITDTIFTTPEVEKFYDFVRISDTQKYHKYYVEDEKGNTFLLSSDNDYLIGDQIFLSAYRQDLDLSKIFVKTGNTIFSTDFWNYDFNYDKWLFMKGVDGILYEQNSVKADLISNGKTIQGKTSSFEPISGITKIRRWIQINVTSIFGKNKYAGLLLGLLIGDKSFIPTDEYTTFTNSGLVHIIAVSGGNMAMIVILLGFLFCRLPFYAKNFVMILGIIFYAMLCGNDSSVIRAAIMGILTLMALFRGREVSIRRSMAYAFVGILIFNPFSLGFDIGFILSFAAIIGIVLFQKITQRSEEEIKIIKQNNKFDFLQCKFWKEYLVPTIGASLGTAPILIFFMQGVNLVGIILNVFIVPIIPIITIYGFISVILSIIIPWNLWIFPEKIFMDIIYLLADFGTNYAIYLQTESVIKKYILVVVFIVLWLVIYCKCMLKAKNCLRNINESDKEKENENQTFDKVLDEM